jgi:hypothetical protein
MVINLGVLLRVVSIRNISGIFVRISAFFVLYYFRENGTNYNR